MVGQGHIKSTRFVSGECTNNTFVSSTLNWELSCRTLFSQKNTAVPFSCCLVLKSSTPWLLSQLESWRNGAGGRGLPFYLVTTTKQQQLDRNWKCMQKAPRETTYFIGLPRGRARMENAAEDQCESPNSTAGEMGFRGTWKSPWLHSTTYIRSTSTPNKSQS